MTTSANPFPAFFASSIAPVQSPANTFLIALPKKPMTSNISLNLEIISFFIVPANSFIVVCGSLNNAFMKSVTTLKLEIKKFIKSVITIETASVATANKFTTF